MKMRRGDTLRIGKRLGRVDQDEHGDTVYKHRRGPGTSRHPDAEFASDAQDRPGWFIDWIWGARELVGIVFIGIFLCIPSWCVARLFVEMVA